MALYVPIQHAVTNPSSTTSMTTDVMNGIFKLFWFDDDDEQWIEFFALQLPLTPRLLQAALPMI